MRFFPQSHFMLLFVLCATACYTPRGIHTKTMAEPEKAVSHMVFLPVLEVWWE